MRLASRSRIANGDLQVPGITIAEERLDVMARTFTGISVGALRAQRVKDCWPAAHEVWL